MAISEWTGAVSSDPNNAGNWTAGAVAAGQDLYITGSINIDGFDHSAIAVDSINVSPSFTGTIGASGNPWIIDCLGVLRMQGGGDEAWFEGDYPIVIAGPVKTTANACQIKGVGTNIDDLVVIGGNVQIVTGSTIVRVHLIGGGSVAGRPNLTIPTGCTVTDVNVTSGVMAMSSSPSGVVTIAGGTYKHMVGTATLAMVVGGEYLFYDGTITTLRAFKGFFSTAIADAIRTITNADLYAAARFDLDAQTTVTWTNDPKLYGAQPLLPHGIAILMS